MDKKPPWRKTSEEQRRRERKVRRNEQRQSIQIKGLQSHNKRKVLKPDSEDQLRILREAVLVRSGLSGPVFGFRLPTPLGGDCRPCLCCPHYGEVGAGTKPTGRARVVTSTPGHAMCIVLPARRVMQGSLQKHWTLLKDGPWPLRMRLETRLWDRMPLDVLTRPDCSAVPGIV